MKRWARNYDACVTCGKTNEVHDGRGICRLCRAKATYQKNKAKIIEATIRRARAYKLSVLSHYSQGRLQCACCGEDTYEFLVIDHINGGGNQQRIALGVYGKHFFRWLIKEGFPQGYQVLCHNCNMAKGFHGICPHVKPKHASQATQASV